MTLCNEMMQLIIHARRSVERLADEYHDWGPNLAGYCGIASRFLINLGKRNGIHNMRLVCGTFDDNTHCWVEYDGFCLDITITQFNGFQNKAYRICMIDSDFYREHYMPAIIGHSAVKQQKQWELGQDYESCATILWQIHKRNYINECNGLLFVKQ